MLAVQPPIAPMLARLVRELPLGALTYEPKWDGFRCLAWVDGDSVELRSRHDRPLARYFPEVVGALRGALAGTAGAVLDGELIVDDAASAVGAPIDEPAFERLMRRLHPAASRVERLAAESPARFVAFDVLDVGWTDLRGRPFVERRRILEELLEGAREPRVALTPATRDSELADRWLDGAFGPGVDGVVAKPDDLAYEPGRRTMIKVKRLRTAECVVAGLRVAPGPAVSSLLLGLYDAAEQLRHVGVVVQLPVADRVSLLDDLAPIVVPLASHPWRDGFAIGRSPLGRLPGSAARWTPEMEHDWVPLRPERVVEVGFDQVDGDRFRHPARLVRWRPDRDPRSCGLDQITASVRVPVGS